MKQLFIKISNGVSFAVETDLPKWGLQQKLDEWLTRRSKKSAPNFVHWLRGEGYHCDLLKIKPE